MSEQSDPTETSNANNAQSNIGSDESSEKAKTDNGKANVHNEKLPKIELKDRQFVRLRGLPYSAGEDEIRKFFEGINVVDVILTLTGGRPSGECFCEFSSIEDLNKAMERNNSLMSTRYIEVFEVGDVELDNILRRTKIKQMTSDKGFIRIRGLPFNCTIKAIHEFFDGLNVEDVVFGKSSEMEGRPSGDGFVQFSSSDEADRAVEEFNHKHLGSRYLEIFKIDGSAYEIFKQSSMEKAIPLKYLTPVAPNMWGYGPPQYSAPYPGPYGFGGYDRYNEYNTGGYDDYGPPRGASGYGGFRRGRGGRFGGSPGGGNPRYRPYGGGHDGYRNTGGMNSEHVSPVKLFIRGIPFQVTLKEVQNFFAPLNCVHVFLGELEGGRSSGDAIVEFANPQDAERAMMKDRQNIGSRYVEIFPTNSIKISPLVHYRLISGGGGGMYSNNNESNYTNFKSGGSLGSTSGMSGSGAKNNNGTIGNRIPTTTEKGPRPLNSIQKPLGGQKNSFSGSNGNGWSSKTASNSGYGTASSYGYAGASGYGNTTAQPDYSSGYGASQATYAAAPTTYGGATANSGYAGYGTTSTGAYGLTATTTAAYDYNAYAAAYSTAPGVSLSGTVHGTAATNAQMMEDYYKAYYAQNGYAYAVPQPGAPAVGSATVPATTPTAAAASYAYYTSGGYSA